MNFRTTRHWCSEGIRIFILPWLILAVPMLRAQPTGSRAVSWGGVTTNCVADVVAAASGYGFNLFLRSDGTVSACGTTWPAGSAPAMVPADLTNCSAVAASWFSGLALTAKGTVASWYATTGEAKEIPGLTNVVAISSTVGPGLALKADGTVHGFGSWNTNVPSGLTNVTELWLGSATTSTARPLHRRV